MIKNTLNNIYDLLRGDEYASLIEAVCPFAAVVAFVQTLSSAKLISTFWKLNISIYHFHSKEIRLA